MSRSLPRHRRLRRVLASSAVLLALGGYASGSAAESPYPGLPAPTQPGGWAGVVQNGVTESTKARQWVRVPMQALAAFTTVSGRNYPASDPRTGTTTVTNLVYFVAPSGSQHNYGISPRFTVRTVAFGAIPVEATLQLWQRRDGDLPVPITVTSVQDVYRVAPPGRPSASHALDTSVEDAVILQVDRLVVDGVDLTLSNACRTAQPGKISLAGKGWWGGDPTVDEQQPWNTGNFAAGQGGVLNGTVDVPPFAGCVTSGGEDVSRLLTSTISGPGNPVQLNVGPPTCSPKLPPPSTNTGPPRPGATTPEAAECTPDQIPPLVPIP